jgi:hypothetical protein
VHYLQHRQRGERMRESGEAVLASEREAYAAQNSHLGQFKQWRRVGEVLRFSRCPEGRTASEPVVQHHGAVP